MKLSESAIDGDDSSSSVNSFRNSDLFEDSDIFEVFVSVESSNDAFILAERNIFGALALVGLSESVRDSSFSASSFRRSDLSEGSDEFESINSSKGFLDLFFLS